MTETGGQVCTSEAGRPSTCGSPLPGRQVRRAADGELLVSGTGLLAGFVDQDAFVPALGPDGAYATGDLGRREDGGWVIVGRKDFQFISGGENIQPEALAAALGDSKVGVVIVPVPDDRFGQRPFCFYEGAADDASIVGSLRTRADRSLPRFMHPVAFARLPAVSGTKHRRAELVALAARLHTEGGAASSEHESAPSPAGVTDGL
jgi:O-succinylbenzoic acid--CoA ligase